MERTVRRLALGRWVWYVAAGLFVLSVVSTLPISTATPALASLPLAMATLLTWPLAFAGRWRAGAVAAALVVVQTALAFALLGEPLLPDPLLAAGWIAAFLIPIGVMTFVLRCLSRRSSEHRLPVRSAV